jgi:hypothetical protein
MMRQSLIKVCFAFIFVMSLFNPSFQMSASAATVPTLITPADGATITSTGSGANASPPAAIPVFSWTPVDGATRYRVQFSRDIAFSVPYEVTTQLTSLVPPPQITDQMNDGLWYWRAREEEPVAGSYPPSPHSFIKQWATLANYPVLLSPADGATLQFYVSPTFSWQPVIGAAAYRFQISTSLDFSAPIYNDLVLATSVQPANKFSNGTRYWRVVPVDPVGRDGTPSQVRSFIMGNYDIPELLEPANNSFPTFTPTFRWKAVRGTQFYRLWYSTDPAFNANLTQIDTRNTTYTPTTVMPNDVNYYWKVRAYSGATESDWSPVWTFRKQWYIRPVLLTPTNNFTHIRFPYFSWAPVPGASFYRIEIDDATDFLNTLISEDTSNPFYTPRYWNGNWTTIYWRVIPFDANSNRGKESVTYSFVTDSFGNTPVQYMPYYYYPPNFFPPPFSTVSMHPYADRTAAWPTFTWGRVTALPSGATFATAYRIQVSTISDFSNIVWTVDTQNTNATPTTASPFVPLAGQDYFWRVRCLNGVGGEIGNWSQTWKARFSLSPVTPTTPPPPQLLRPIPGSEIVDTTPLFEWNAVTGADAYDVQIAGEPTFAAPVDTGLVPYPAYSPTNSLAQRSLNKINFGTFYWRVRARSGGNPLGAWSEARRFQIAAQSERLETRYSGIASNRLLVASDPVDTATNGFELTNLYVTQDSNYWYFGFNATITSTNMSYGLYLDLDHQDNSGADVDPRGNSVTATPAFRPEYAVYINKVSNKFSAAQTYVYGWNGVYWDTPNLLNDIGGAVYYDPAGGFVEIRIPNTSIGMRDETGSYAMSLFSVPTGSSQQPVDSVPSDPAIPGSGPITRFVSVSERMNQVAPAYTPAGDPTTLPFFFPFVSDYPTGLNGTAPWAGSRIQMFIDPLFTTKVSELEITSDTAYYATVSHTWGYDVIGNNTYYWRVQPCYLFPNTGRVCGAWSQGGRFERKGFVAQNLQESVSFATPTLSWDIVEGASLYELQVDDNSNFGSLIIGLTTAQNSYTYPDTLQSGTYYWRVRVIRWNGPASDWSSAKTFTLTLPKPTGLMPNDPNPLHAVSTMPTYCWDPLIVSANGAPVLAAWRYIVQVSRGDPNFSSIYDLVDTEQSCWTPRIGYEDGTYYWHVAMVDGAGRMGGFSNPAVFTKQYPAAKPLSPVGSTVSGTPTFIWTAADGVTPYVFGAARYRIEISQDPNFASLYDHMDVVTTRYTPMFNYEDKKTYYWRVAIIDKDGKLGPFSDAMLLLSHWSNHNYLPRLVKP